MTETSEWSCGHVAGAMCQECFRVLARRAHELAVENLALKSDSVATVQFADSHARLFRALQGVVRVSDRRTVEYDEAHAAMKEAELLLK